MKFAHTLVALATLLPVTFAATATTKVIAKERSTLSIDACAQRGWCEVNLYGKRVLAMAEMSDDDKVTGVCVRASSDDVKHIANAMGALPQTTRSGAVCLYRSTKDRPASPAFAADGTL
jgi:hypothetical protein